jgi:DNA gyrase/topoisomerase IV subunit A
MSSRRGNPMLAMRQNNLQSELIRLQRLEDEHVEDVKKLQKNMRDAQQTLKKVAQRLRLIKGKEQQVKKILAYKRRAEKVSK